MSWVITVKVPHAQPVIDRSKSGLRINGGELLPPGNYNANVGDNFEVVCYVTSETAGKIATIIMLNDEEKWYWEDVIEAGGSVSHTHTGTFTEKGTYEISIVTGYWDPSTEGYIRYDEYGC